VKRSWQDQNRFREGIEWTTNGSAWEDEAFNRFTVDGQIDEATPFGGGGTFGYKYGYVVGTGEHPVLTYRTGGSAVSGESVAKELPDPFSPF
jgi:hypothetical protein